MTGYGAAWYDGFNARWWTIRPFWRGKKYLRAWDNGARRRRFLRGLVRILS